MKGKKVTITAPNGKNISFIANSDDPAEVQKQVDEALATYQNHMEQFTDTKPASKEVLDEHFELGRKEGTTPEAFAQGMVKGVPVLGDVLNQGGLLGPVKPDVQRAYQAGVASGSPVADMTGQAATIAALLAGGEAASKSGKLKKIPKIGPLLESIGQILNPRKGTLKQKVVKGGQLGLLTGGEQMARGLLNMNQLDYYKAEDGSFDVKAFIKDVGISAATGAIAGGASAGIMGISPAKNMMQGRSILQSERNVLEQKMKFEQDVLKAAKNKDKTALENLNKNPFSARDRLTQDGGTAKSAAEAGVVGGIAAGGKVYSNIQKGRGLLEAAANVKKSKDKAELIAKATELMSTSSTLKAAGSGAGVALGIYLLRRAPSLWQKFAKGDFDKLAKNAELKIKDLQRQMDEVDRGLSVFVTIPALGAGQSASAVQSEQNQKQQWSE